MRGLHLLLISALLLWLTGASAQKSSLEIGIKTIHEITFSDGYAPGAGIPVVYRIGKHGGLESGCYYKIRPSHPLMVNNSGALVKQKLTEHTLIIPLSYRYDSRFINFSVGAALEIFLSKRYNSAEYATLRNLNSTVPELISTASISKSLTLPGSLVLEPEIRFSAFVPNGDGGWGLNVSLRKKIF